jgi:hypothetical protein
MNNIPRPVLLGVLGGLAWFAAGIFVGFLIWG